MSNATKWLVLGLQGTGKTTFLASLWHQLEAAELQTVVSASQLQPDRTYLNRIRDAWLAVEAVPRTSRRAEQVIALNLRAGDLLVDVTLPDPSGEGLASIWSKRVVADSFSSQAREATGILLFLHPQRVRTDDRIPLADNAAATTATAEVQAWRPDFASTQVQIVDLLQVTADLRSGVGPTPLSVIVSAWDLVHDSLTPSDWVQHRLPLLWQFLAAGDEYLPRYYGISATGGDIDVERARLAAFLTAAERVSVAEDDGQQHHDLTVPLQHLLQNGGTAR